MHLIRSHNENNACARALSADITTLILSYKVLKYVFKVTALLMLADVVLDCLTVSGYY